MIQQVRKARNLDQEALAAIALVGVRTIRRAESGHDISINSLNSIANALGEHVNRLTIAADDDDNLIFSDRASHHEASWIAEILSFSYLHFRTESWLLVTLKVVNDIIRREIPPSGINTKHMAMLFYASRRDVVLQYFQENKDNMDVDLQSLFMEILNNDSRWSS